MQGGVDDSGIVDVLEQIAGFGVPEHDYIEINYTDATKTQISTVVYKTGGSTGDVVATITVATPTATKETYTKT